MTVLTTRCTDITFYHSTDEQGANGIHNKGHIKATFQDKNPACGKVGLKKVWCCAPPQKGSGGNCCRSFGNCRFPITPYDLKKISHEWHIYRTKDWSGYKKEGKLSKNMFYNFFLVPANLPLKKKAKKKLVRADCNDRDPVQMFWNGGKPYVKEVLVGDDSDDSTDSEEMAGDDDTSVSVGSDDTEVDEGETRRFHVAIVCWKLELSDIDDGTTVESDSSEDYDGDGDKSDTDSSTKDSDDNTSSEDDTDSSDQSMKKESDSEASDSSETLSDLANENLALLANGKWRSNSKKKSDKNRQRCALPCPVSELEHVERIGEKYVKHYIQPIHENLNIVDSVSTSVRAQKDLSEADRCEDRANFHAAVDQMVLHATDINRPVLTEKELVNWHTILLARQTQRAGILRDNCREARCGNLFFVKASDVKFELDRMLKQVDGIMHESNISIWKKAAYTMYYLISIHPFGDGNGRLSRLLAAWVLLRSGGIIPGALCTPGKQRVSYINAIRSVQESDGRNFAKLAKYIQEYSCISDSSGSKSVLTCAQAANYMTDYSANLIQQSAC